MNRAILNPSRREFLKTGMIAAATCGWAGSIATGAAPPTRQLAEIGIIGGVPKDAGSDWQQSLRRMAQFGYKHLEARPRGTSVEEYLRFLKEIGLTLIGCGIDFGKKLKPDWLDAAVACKARYAVVYWPWFYSPAKLDLPQFKEIAEQLNKAGEQAKAAGLKLAVHNHDKEFRVLDGKPIFDRLLDLTQPDLLAIELDIYWAVKGGVDPLDYFRRYPGRFELFHVKDMGPPPDQDFVAVGSGTIDFKRIFAQFKQAGVKYYIVELEGKANTMKAAEESCRYLKQLRF